MTTIQNREAAVSGRFYPAYPKDLKEMLQDLFFYSSKPEADQQVRAIIVPHAGYVFSGEVAAAAFSQIDRKKEFENIFILAPSHYASFNGASIYNQGNYETPLGVVDVNIDLANALIKKSDLFGYNKEAHRFEHSIEVQLPFLQYWLKSRFKIVPILIGSQQQSILKNFANELKPYFNDRNLFVISSDFSHFPDYKGAQVADKNMEKAVMQKSIEALNNAIDLNDSLEIANLSTSACGLSAIKTLFYLIENDPGLEILKRKYLNSGDTERGEHSRVVGYLSFVVVTIEKKENEFHLSENNRTHLLTLARKSIENTLRHDKNEIIHEKNLDPDLLAYHGCFVSLHKSGELRGCVGRFEPDFQLFELVQKMAVAAAFNDSRFPDLELEELKDIDIEISVLSPLKQIFSSQEVEIGKHGILISQGLNRGTLLPQVAPKNNWNAEEFISFCSKHKAGLGWDGWKTAELFTYTAEIFSE